MRLQNIQIRQSHRSCYVPIVVIPIVAAKRIEATGGVFYQGDRVRHTVEIVLRKIKDDANK